MVAQTGLQGCLPAGMMVPLLSGAAAAAGAKCSLAKPSAPPRPQGQLQGRRRVTCQSGSGGMSSPSASPASVWVDEAAEVSSFQREEVGAQSPSPRMVLGGWGDDPGLLLFSPFSSCAFILE